MTRSTLVVLLIITVALITGCKGGAPVQDITNAPVSATSGTAPSLSAIGNAMVKAGVGLGWGMRVVSPGHVEGTLNLRKHTAVVDITFDTKTYNIKYKSSANLKYNAAKGTIHKNYNSWVRNLNNAILAQLASL